MAHTSWKVSRLLGIAHGPQPRRSEIPISYNILRQGQSVIPNTWLNIVPNYIFLKNSLLCCWMLGTQYLGAFKILIAGWIISALWPPKLKERLKNGQVQVLSLVQGRSRKWSPMTVSYWQHETFLARLWIWKLLWRKTQPRFSSLRNSALMPPKHKSRVAEIEPQLGLNK